jgi:hypothetical protein
MQETMETLVVYYRNSTYSVYDAYSGIRTRRTNTNLSRLRFRCVFRVKLKDKTNA